jgi:hypothetical protein
VVRCAPPEDPARLTLTAALMRAAPGIAVDVLDVDEGPPLVVTLSYAGRVPSAPMPGTAAAALGAKVAVAVSDLATLGITHGAIELDHILVDAAGAVRLCGFGECGPGDGTADVRALGDVLDALVHADDRSDAAVAVRAIAARTRGAEAPTAAAIAASLATIGAPPRVDAPPSPARRSSGRRLRRRLDRSHLVTAATVALLALAATVVLAWPEGARAARPPVAIDTTTSTSTPASPTTTTSTLLDARRVWPSTPLTVEGAGATWRLGDEGDTVVVGAWGCRPVATPALVRVDGTVWILHEWIDDQPASYVTTIEGGVVDVRVEQTRGCDDLVVTTTTGTVRPLA